jgi:hypothetical protein
MASLLEDIASLVPKSKTVRLSLVPDKPIDVWVLSEVHKGGAKQDLSLGLGAGRTCYLNLYVRQSPQGVSTYNGVDNDISLFYNTLCGYIGTKLGDRYISDVRDFDLIPLGRDDSGNYLFSTNFVVETI